jgi:hypothetical protein
MKQRPYKVEVETAPGEVGLFAWYEPRL